MYRVLLVEDEEIELETLRDYIDWKKNGISRVFTCLLYTSDAADE